MWLLFLSLHRPGQNDKILFYNLLYVWIKSTQCIRCTLMNTIVFKTCQTSKVMFGQVNFMAICPKTVKCRVLQSLNCWPLLNSWLGCPNFIGYASHMIFNPHLQHHAFCTKLTVFIVTCYDIITNKGFRATKSWHLRKYWSRGTRMQKEKVKLGDSGFLFYRYRP